MTKTIGGLKRFAKEVACPSIRFRPFRINFSLILGATKFLIFHFLSCPRTFHEGVRVEISTMLATGVFACVASDSRLLSMFRVDLCPLLKRLTLIHTYLWGRLLMMLYQMSSSTFLIFLTFTFILLNFSIHQFTFDVLLILTLNLLVLSSQISTHSLYQLCTVFIITFLYLWIT